MGGGTRNAGADWLNASQGWSCLARGASCRSIPRCPIDCERARHHARLADEWSCTRPPGGNESPGRTAFAATPRDVLRGDYLACQAFDTRRLAQIAAPTPVIGAEDDCMVPLKFSRTSPNASLTRGWSIERAGHMFPLEQPKPVAQAITSWLAEPAMIRTLRWIVTLALRWGGVTAAERTVRWRRAPCRQPLANPGVQHLRPHHRLRGSHCRVTVKR